MAFEGSSQKNPVDRTYPLNQSRSRRVGSDGSLLEAEGPDILCIVPKPMEVRIDRGDDLSDQKRLLPSKSSSVYNGMN